ncbi:hypothetical protein HN018_26460 (plasmid) [Lichenicola cladoniae]|uniref:HTH crp-type domain-containing protein n=1 Tax=Lichenicola cladoniae TaxID=1484109 RepID=A0A6M8HYR8_9PROT|nr:hypothetical protein [Lichenicola cladoniae]NPD69333.1 hypothetical protein [Acetobacteraceae bacterium]QKE93683.1 hypothetical protein HN018_26460 [Lichenicola cladoniae]
MIDPEKDSSVVRWLIENSKHPYKALNLWAMLSTHLVSYVIPQTGEIATQIMLTRREIAKTLMLSPRHVSQIVRELVLLEVMFIKREGDSEGKYMGSRRYFMNQEFVRPISRPSHRLH